MRVTAAAAILLAMSLSARSQITPDAVLKDIYRLQIEIRHCGAMFAGDMPGELNSQAERLRKLVKIDDAALKQIMAALYSDVRAKADCGPVRANVIPNAWKLIQTADQIR